MGTDDGNQVRREGGWVRGDSDIINVRVFRALIMTGMVGYPLWVALTYAEPWLYSGDVLDVLSWRGVGSSIAPTPIYPVLSLTLYLASSVALLCFSRSGRLVFTALFACDNLVAAASGVFVATGLEIVLGSVTGTASAGALVLAWTPPLRDRFRRHQPPAP